MRGAIGRTGYEDRHAWSFFISMVDFVQLFSCVYVCNVLPSNWHTNTLHGSWDDGSDDDSKDTPTKLQDARRRSRSGGSLLQALTGGAGRPATAGGCSKNKATYLNNPQFVLYAESTGDAAQDIKETCRVQIVLSQADPRRSHVKPYHIHLGAFRNNGNRVDRSLIRLDAGSSGPYTNSREVYMTVLLHPGVDNALTLVVSTYRPGDCGQFTVSAHSKEQVSVELLEDLPRPARARALTWGGF